MRKGAGRLEVVTEKVDDADGVPCEAVSPTIFAISGEAEATLGKSATPNQAELCPVPVSETTEMVPEEAFSGTTATIRLPSTMLNEVAFTLPKRTAVAAEKLKPLIVTAVPGRPAEGLNEVILGDNDRARDRAILPVAEPKPSTAMR